LPLTLAAVAITLAPATGRPAAGPPLPSCSLAQIAPLLAPAAGAVVLADPEATPELLYRSNAMTVGSLYQHGVPGYLRDREAWRSAPAAVEPTSVRATAARFVLFCPQPQRLALVADLPPQTLWDALAAGTPPQWLKLTGTDAAGWRLYRIEP